MDPFLHEIVFSRQYFEQSLIYLEHLFPDHLPALFRIAPFSRNIRASMHPIEPVPVIPVTCILLFIPEQVILSPS
jgi:hypothetical protein